MHALDVVLLLGRSKSKTSRLVQGILLEQLPHVPSSHVRGPGKLRNQGSGLQLACGHNSPTKSPPRGHCHPSPKDGNLGSSLAPLVVIYATFNRGSLNRGDGSTAKRWLRSGHPHKSWMWPHMHL